MQRKSLPEFWRDRPFVRILNLKQFLLIISQNAIGSHINNIITACIINKLDLIRRN